MDEDAVGIAASISEELMAKDTNRRRPIQCRKVRASINNGDASYDGAAGGKRGVGDGSMEGKHHDTGAGEVAGETELRREPETACSMREEWRFDFCSSREANHHSPMEVFSQALVGVGRAVSNAA
ncbi:hypothetical protein S83_006457 [Arachis hypogaea]